MNTLYNGKAVMLVIFFSLYQSAFSANFIQIKEDELAKVKKSLMDGTASAQTVKAFNSLIKSANLRLKKEVQSVINKSITPASGDMHDYISISRYWWPNPDTEDGLPWIRKDGVTNPASKDNSTDKQSLLVMCNAVRYLSLAYYFTDNALYAQKAVEVLRVWFIHEGTKMNPHLEYAQSVPGIPKSRRSGILDGRIIPTMVLDPLVILSNSEHWTSNDQKEMSQWLRKYLSWLTESNLGKLGAKQENNHGSWYRFQVAALAWHLADTTLTIETINLTKASLVRQLDENGSQPHEVERTRSFFYSCFNLDALTRIAIIADKAGVPIWNYNTAEGKGLKMAIDYLVPVAQGEEWGFKTIKEIDLGYLAPLLNRYIQYNKTDMYIPIVKEIVKDYAEKEKLKGQQRKVREECILLYPDQYF